MKHESLIPAGEKVELGNRLQVLHDRVFEAKDRVKQIELENMKLEVARSLQGQFPKVDGVSQLRGIPEWEALIGGGEYNPDFDETVRAVVIQEFEEFLDAVEAEWKIE